PFQRKSAARTQSRVPRVSTVTKKFPTVDSKFSTAKSTFTAYLGNKGKAVKASACWIWRPKQNTSEKGKITGKGIIKTGKLEFENVYFVKELKYNLFSVSQICDNKNSVHFTDSECIVLGKDFKLKDDTNVLLRTPRQHNMYSIDLNNVVPHKNLTCLVAKPSVDKSMLWHRRLGHLNFKTMNKLVSNNLVKGLPYKCFENDHTCVACLKGKQHKASCKTKFTWTFFLRTKDETSGILRNFITEIENLKDLKMKIIRCDNGDGFKNKEMNEFCTKKGIKREFSNARTPQQNGVAERMNRTLIEAARTMLADAKLLVTFWAEAVNTACYVQNKVLVNKSQNKTPYELFNSRTPAIGFLRPFGCYVMILNTIDHLGKFDAKGDEGYFVGYSMSRKAFRVFNKITKKVEENLHVDFSENKPIEKGAGPNWLFDIDTLTNSMNYVPVVVLGTSSTNISGTKDDASQAVKKDVSSLRYIALPNWFHEVHMKSSNNDAQYACNADAPESSRISNPIATSKTPPADQMESLTVESKIPTVSSYVPTVCLDISPETSSGSTLISKGVISQEETPSLDNALTLSNRFEDTIRVEADLSNMESITPASPTPTFRTNKDHPKRIRPIGTKWVLKNNKDERGIVIRNKARLVAQGHTHEEEIDCEEVFAPVARIEAIRLFLAYASFMGFIVYRMDVKSAFLYGTIDEEVYVMQPPGFQDPEFPDRVYKVEKAMYGLHQAPRSWYGTLSKYLLDNGFQRVTIDQTLFIRKHKGEFLLVQVSANTPMDKENPWGKDGPGKDVKLHLYRSMIGSLMYLTASRPDIMFAVCACARHQVTPKECHLYVVKRIFRYLKGHPKLGLWYPKESPFDLVAYSDSDYGGATQDRKSTIGGCQFLGRRLISWQCKKQTIVATSTTKAEYIAAASGCGQVLWIQNQMLDYGENINKTSALPHESSQRVTSLDADEGIMQQQLQELMDLCTSLQRQRTQMAAKIKDQDLEISGLKARVKFLEDKDRGRAEPSQEDALIKGETMEIGEEVRVEKITELRSNDTKQMVNVLSSMEAANILTSGVAAVSVSPVAAATTVGVPTVNGLFPIANKGKEKVVESEVPKKRKLQEQIDAQVAKEIDEDFARGNKRLNEQIARDSKIARLHAEEELKMMIEGLDRRNEVIAKHLQEYEQAAADLSVREKIELINELTKHFRGMTLEKIKEKFIPVWKQLEDFVPISSKEESKRVERQGSSKRMKTSKSASEGVSVEELKEMMQLVPLEKVYVEALQVKHHIIDWEIHSEGQREEDLHQLWILVKETLSIKQATKDKEKELWVELKRLFEPDFEDQLWTHNQNFRHDPLEWRLYDTCGVHHVFTKD
nr:ribonuclease H-like domain-containing protein [Tanacetum cinerariifolium]